MSIFKSINDKNNNFDSLKYIINYTTNINATKTVDNIGTVGCRKDNILEDIMMVKNAYHQNNGHFYEHTTLSCTPDYDHVPDSVYMEMGKRIAEHYVGYQCVYTLHKNTRCRHLHFVFNNVNYKDGKKLSQGPPDLHRIKTYCNSVLEEYGFDYIKTNSQEMIDHNNHSFEDGWSFLEIYNDLPDDRSDIFSTIEEKKNIDYEYSSFPKSNWYSDQPFNRQNEYFCGGYNMNNNHLPDVMQSTEIAAPSSPNPGGGLDLMTINNIILKDLNDLETATHHISQSIYNNARVGAEALAVLREKGLDESVRVATVNNFYVGSDIHQTNNQFSQNFLEFNPDYNPFKY